MLAKHNRLSRSDIPPLMKRGRRVRAPHMMLVFQQSVTPHFAVIVSKKVAKTAVSRNRLRRRTYTVLRLLPHGMPHVDAAIMMQTGAGNLSVEQLRDEVVGLFAKRQ